MKSKTMLCIFLTAAMAAAAFLPSCSNAQDEISSSTSSAVSVDSTLPISSALSSIPPTGYTSSAPISSIPLPDPVSGTYNSQSIIMQYSVITDYIWPQDNLIPTYFLNGYTPFWYYGTDSIDPIFAYSNIGATFLDKTGRMICEPIYASASYFNDEGLGLVQKELDSGRWTYIDADGNEVSEVQNPQFSDIQISEYVNGLKFAKLDEGEHRNVIMNEAGETVAVLPDDKIIEGYVASDSLVVCGIGDDDLPYSNYYQIYDINGNLISETKFDRIGNCYNGLIPFYLDGKLGIMGDDGSIVIPASYPIELNYYYSFILNEDLIIVNTEGKVGIIEIIRS